MVKGFDTSQNDVSKAVLDYIFYIFQKDPPLSLPKAQTYIKQLIADPQTSTHQVYKKFNEGSIKPNIRIYKNCSKPLLNKIMNIIPYNGDQNFPAYYNHQEQTIAICLEHIKNKIQLKQNLDRQLYTLHYKQSANHKQQKIQQKQKDRMLMKSLYQGCYQGYRNYLLPEHQTYKISKKCAKYLFRRRTQNNLPHDSLFRYADRLGQQL